MTIVLVPNFNAVHNVDLPIETSWGDRLGAIIERGPTLPFAGEPRALGEREPRPVRVCPDFRRLFEATLTSIGAHVVAPEIT